MKDKTIEEILVNRKSLEDEYNAIKAHLLQKVNRMDEIEQLIVKIDQEINNRYKTKKK
jgi:hypothetical protein